MSSQQPSTPQDPATLVWRAVMVALITGFVWGIVFFQLLMLPDLLHGGLGIFTGAALTFATYFLTRAALNSLRP